MLDGLFNPDFFHRLQTLYRDRTGYHLVLSDNNGSIQMGLPDCEKFPCMSSCRECREQIVREALRTGKVCIDACHEGYILWGLPFSVNGKTVGGLIVIGGAAEKERDNENFGEACAELYHLMREHDLLPQPVQSQPADSSTIHRFVFRRTFEKLNQAVERNGRPLLNALQTAEFSVAKRHFEEIRRLFLDAAGAPMDVLHGIAGDLVCLGKRQFTEAGMDPYACASEAGLLLQKTSAAKDPKQLAAVLSEFFDRFVVLSGQRTKDPDDLLIDKATTYLEEHIREDLTRESVAKAVGLSPSHFSRLLRLKKGRTFTDLLNQYRIERSAKLLVRSSKTLAEIANETGFCDQSYFSKVFRRYKQVSPARYREQQQR